MEEKVNSISYSFPSGSEYDPNPQVQQDDLESDIKEPQGEFKYNFYFYSPHLLDSVDGWLNHFIDISNNMEIKEEDKIPSSKNNEQLPNKLIQSKNNSSNNSKNSTKNSSNSNNDLQEHSVIYNNETKFKLFKVLNIPERFNKINIELDMSCHNLYYEKKKHKIKEKIKKDYNVKKIKMEDYEKPLIREFKKFIKKNRDNNYKDFINQDKIFWDLFLGNKNEVYTSDEKKYKKEKFEKYNQKFLHYLFGRKDIKELYNNEFKAHCKQKNKNGKNNEIIYHFYSQYFDDLYKEEISDISFKVL